MLSHSAGRRASWFTSVRVRAVLALGVALGVGATGTFAFWTDDVVVSGTSFTAGSLDLRVNGQDTVTAYTALDFAAATPGQSSAAVLTIRSNGTAPLKYTATQTATNTDGKNLRTYLQVKVTTATTATGSFPTGTCAGTAISGFATSFAGGTFLTPGRQLAGGTEEKICVQVTLDANAPNAVQGAASTVGFTFTGTSNLA